MFQLSTLQTFKCKPIKILILHKLIILSLVVAVISGAEGTCVQWEAAVEEGFVFLDLAVLSQSSNLLRFVRDIPGRWPGPSVVWQVSTTIAATAESSRWCCPRPARPGPVSSW